MSLQNVPIIGRVAGDPEMKFIASGKALLKFSLVTSKRRKVDDEWKDENTTFWNVTVWGQDAEAAAETLAKGQQVVVVGEVYMRGWETPEGEKRSTNQIDARTIAVVVNRSQSVKSSKVQRESGGQQQTGRVLANGYVDNDDPWASQGQPAQSTSSDFPF